MEKRTGKTLTTVNAAKKYLRKFEQLRFIWDNLKIKQKCFEFRKIFLLKPQRPTQTIHENLEFEINSKILLVYIPLRKRFLRFVAGHFKNNSFTLYKVFQVLCSAMLLLLFVAFLSFSRFFCNSCHCQCHCHRC